MSQSGDGGVYAPATKTISVKEALAKGDAEQAKQLRVWADEIDAAAAAGDVARLMHATNAMRNAAFIVERFTGALLERMSAQHG